MTSLRHHLRHSLRVSRCSTLCSSLLLFLYSLILFLISVPIASSLTVHSTAHPHPAPPPPAPPSTSSSDEATPLSLHAPILSLLPCYGVYELKGRRHYMEDTHAVFVDQQLSVSRLAAQSAFAQEALILRGKEQQQLVQAEQEEEKAVVDGSSADGRADWVLFGVFDGHGGHDASAYTATHLLPLIHTNLSSYRHPLHAALPPSSSSPSPSPSPYLLPSSHALSSLFHSTFQRVDSAYLDHPLAHHRTHPHADGSTAIVVAIQRLPTPHPHHHHSPLIVVANAGDCRALLVTEDTGEGKELTTLAPSWRERLGGMCRRERGESDSDNEEEQEGGGEVPELCVEGAQGESAAEEEEEEEELDDAKTAEITAAELLHMYHTFHPNLSHPTESAFLSSSPSPSPSPPLFVPLSIDHKPHLPVERAYITSLPSGFITTSRYHSISRVQGVLATSRAIGDYELKPWVRCEPDVVVWGGEGGGGGEGDVGGGGGLGRGMGGVGRWVVIGSDGFFDAWSSEDVSGWVREMGGRGMGVQRMAKELVKAAYRRGSDDNITVVVVDLHCIAQTHHTQHHQHPPSPA